MEKINKLFYLVGFVFLLFSTSLIADLQSDVNEKINEKISLFEWTGVTAKLEKDNKINFYIDMHQALIAMPTLQEKDFLNPDITQTMINGNRSFYASLVGLLIITASLPILYETPVLDKIFVTVYLAKEDSFGQVTNKKIINFEFNRKLYQKIKWSNFRTENLMKVAPNFKFYEENL
jgi:hypothetical protein